MKENAFYFHYPDTPDEESSAFFDAGAGCIDISLGASSVRRLTIRRGIPRSVTRSSDEFPNAPAVEDEGISREHQGADKQRVSAAVRIMHPPLRRTINRCNRFAVRATTGMQLAGLRFYYFDSVPHPL